MRTIVLTGDALKRAREACGLTQGELARLAGVTQQAVSRLENDDDLSVYVSTATRILNALRELAHTRKVLIEEIVEPLTAA